MQIGTRNIGNLSAIYNIHYYSMYTNGRRLLLQYVHKSKTTFGTTRSIVIISAIYDIHTCKTTNMSTKTTNMYNNIQYDD